ncbi:MAG: transposase [Acidobacteriota bacterium]
MALYNKRAAVENLIQEANNDIGLAAHPSGQWSMNANHFQLSMIAYNLNCWLALFEREESLTVPELTHRTVATNRLRLLYLAARTTRHGGQTEIHFGAQYQERNRFDQLMARWRAIERSLPGFAPVIHTPLRAWKSMHGAMARRQTGPKGEISKTKLLAQSPDADGGCAVATKRSGQSALAVNNLGITEPPTSGLLALAPLGRLWRCM